MKYLIQGGESEKKVSLLLELTDVRSCDLICAINYYYVTGHQLSTCCALTGVDKGQLSRAMKSIEHKAKVYEQLKELELIR